MPQNAELPVYQSYLLRCWLISPANEAEPARWRFALRDVAAEPTELVFVSAADLVDFLEAGASAGEPDNISP